MDNSPNYDQWDLPHPTAAGQTANGGTVSTPDASDAAGNPSQNSLSASVPGSSPLSLTSTNMASINSSSQEQLQATSHAPDPGVSLEKTVVEKVKDIISQTPQDPHRQLQEINRVKAEYLQQRYNKTLKMDE